MTSPTPEPRVSDERLARELEPWDTWDEIDREKNGHYLGVRALLDLRDARQRIVELEGQVHTGVVDRIVEDQRVRRGVTDQQVSEARRRVAYRLKQVHMGMDGQYVELADLIKRDDLRAIDAYIESLEQELARLAWRERDADQLIADMDKSAADLRATNERLIGLLREHEWCGWGEGSDRKWCLSCYEDRGEGHCTGCPMAAALGTKEASDDDGA